MTMQSKLPPYRIRISGENYNQLVKLADDYDKELKEKLMKYTFTQEGDIAELRLFPNEIESVFLMILKNQITIEVEKDYYNELKEIRKQYIKNKEKESE